MLELTDTQMRGVVENVVGPDKLPPLQQRIDDSVVLLNEIEPGGDLRVVGVSVMRQARGERQDGLLHDVPLRESKKIVESLGPELTAKDTWWNKLRYKDVTLVESKIVTTDGTVTTGDGISNITGATHLLVEETYRYPTQKENYMSTFVLYLTPEKENELVAQANAEQ